MASIPPVDDSGKFPAASEKTPKPKNGKATDVALSKIPVKQEPLVKITVTPGSGGSPVTLPATKLPFRERQGDTIGTVAEMVEKPEAASPDMQEESAEEEEIDDEDDVDIVEASESLTSSDDSKDGEKQSEKEPVDDEEDSNKPGKKPQRR